jgi:hypothetical protein
MTSEKRLIDARYLTSQMYLICEVCQTENIFIDAIIDEIDNAPNVDAVEVVRCKDCKHLNVLNRKEIYAHCPKTNTVFLTFDIDTREHFCSFGENKNDDLSL